MQLSIEHFVNCQDALCSIYKKYPNIVENINTDTTNITIYGRHLSKDGFYDASYKIINTYNPKTICLVTYTVLHNYKYYLFRADTSNQLLQFGTTQMVYPAHVLVRPFHTLDPDCMNDAWISSIYTALINILSRLPLDESVVIQ